MTAGIESSRASVVEHVDIVYGGHPRGRLDVYVPVGFHSSPPPLLSKDKELAPCVIFVHGGGWKRFSKRSRLTGLHQNVGRALAARGIVTFIPNYRLTTPSMVQLTVGYVLMFGLIASITRTLLTSARTWLTALTTVITSLAGACIQRRLYPGAQHPSHTEDVASAVAWVSRNAHRYGGNPKEITLVGHSAGAHIAGLLLVDPKYLEKAKAPKADQFHGFVGISGPYCAELLSSSLFTRLIYMYPVFGTNPADWPKAFPVERTDTMWNTKVFTEEGNSKQIDIKRENKSSLCIPPVLLINVEHDWGLEAHADKFEKALMNSGAHVERQMISKLNHLNAVFSLGEKGHRSEIVVDIVSEWVKDDSAVRRLSSAVKHAARFAT